jgi:branched-chain amino acid transport system ATP-binding protein
MLSIKNLEAGYGKVQVLHGISMEVPKGKVVTLIGSNGAGKTTTMRAISGMISPSAGEISLNGTRTDGMESFTIAKLGLAHSPEGRRVFATMSVTDNLILGAFPRLTGSRPKGDVNGDLERAMDLFPRLKERRTQLAGTLSGGEQQMLAMARAVMLNPEIVLLDLDGSGAYLGGRGVSHHRRPEVARCDDVAGRTVCRRSTEGGRLRLCARKRPNLRPRAGCAVAR